MKPLDFHEDFAREEEIPTTPDRSLGMLFGFVFFIIGVMPALLGQPARRWAFTVAAIFFAVAAFAPLLLHPLSVFWRGLGLFLHRIVNPLIMGAMFFLVIVPVAVVMRLARRDVMKRSFDRSASSYWIMRESPGTDPGSIRNQY